MINKIVVLFLFFVSCTAVMLPESAYAQDSAMEIERNVNAYNYSRKSLGSRIGAESGLGMVGAAVGAGLTLGSVILLQSIPPAALAVGIILGAGTPALIATGVYYGGVLTGGQKQCLGALCGGIYHFSCWGDWRYLPFNAIYPLK